jgi:hypothetical protein
MDVSEQVLMNLHQISRTARGQMIHSDPGELARSWQEAGGARAGEE